jgi:hypothetical protein
VDIKSEEPSVSRILKNTAATTNVVVSITQNNSDYSDDLNSLRTYCVTGNALELEKHLIHYPGDVNAIFRESDDNTLLHIAVKSGSVECVKVLLSRGAKPDVTNKDKNTPLHLAAQLGCMGSIKVLVENKSDLSIGDESENTPLHLAAMSGSADSVKYLIENGADLLVENKDKHTALYLVLNNVPKGEDILTEILNESIVVTKPSSEKEKFYVSLKVLCPKTKNRMAVANRLYSHHRYNKRVLLHPLLKTLIHVEWKKSKYVVWYRFTSYLLYLLMLTLFVTSSPESVLSMVTRVSAGLLSVHVIIFCFPYLLPGQFSTFRRISKTLLTVIPPTLTIVTVCIPYNAEWCGVSFLLSWFSVPFYSSAISLISYQTGMFVFVTKEMLKHSLVLLFVLVGFSVTFLVLYYDDSDESFNNFWHAFLYTTLVLLQGDSLGDYKTFGGNNTENAEGKDGYVSYVTEALSNMRFASIITSVLFVLLAIIALLNMLVALAVRGGEELTEYGQIYHLWSQVQLLYEWHEVKRFYRRIRGAQPDEQISAQGYVTISATAIPASMRYELSVVVNRRNENKGPKLTTIALEAAVNENISALLREIQDLRESLKKALKSE